MSSESIDLYNTKIGNHYESDSQLDLYDLNDSFIDDSQCSFDVNTYETETEYSSSQYSSDYNYIQYCAKVMIAKFVEFRALFSTKFRRNFIELLLWRHAKFPVG